MDLEGYLSLPYESSLAYDFSAENATEEYCNASSIEKYIIYKTYTSKNDWSNIIFHGKSFREEVRKQYSRRHGRKIIKWIQDPDSDFRNNRQSLLKEIYNGIWPELGSICTYSDTMTSAQYIMSGYFEKEIETGQEKSRRRQRCSARYMITALVAEPGGKGLKEKIEMSAARLDEKKEHLEEFLSAWHMLGNYCPVPNGFNGPRSNFGKHDFGDLTLMMIRKWYFAEDKILKESILKDLLHAQGDVRACADWLNKCGGTQGSGEVRWKKFVQTLCFEDWVNQDYEVIPLWEGHERDHALLPNNWGGFFQECHRRILERTKRLREKLLKMLK